MNVSETHRVDHAALLGDRLLDLDSGPARGKKIYAPDWALEAHSERVAPMRSSSRGHALADPYRDSLCLRDHIVRRRLVGGGGCIGARRRWVDRRSLCPAS